MGDDIVHWNVQILNDTERDFPYLDANSRAKIRQARNEKLAYNNGEGSNSNAEKENTR